MPLIIHQHITIYGIEYVMLPISIEFAIILRTETKANKLIVYFLFCCEACIRNKWLYKNRTNLSVTILGKAGHTVGTIWEIFVVCLDALKERCEIVIRITEIIQLDDFILVK